ncbi:MAG TPA: UDP-glucose/GDP-mannose dehydrogenase family protein [Nocardioidaceae bacterium]|nr:UDP-glucose/GDP-mannose dehydrogenase family protein [Nocardioidaceae bacterium]
MRVSVLGTGYLGATHAACLAAWGHQVVGVDPDEDRIGTLATGRAPFREPGLDDLLREGVSSGRLIFDTALDAARDAEVHFVCVGTPQCADNHAADLTALWRLVDDLAPMLDSPCVVVGKSTVPVGTASRVGDRLRGRAPAGGDVEVAWNPEFLREGCAVQDSLCPDRLVLGVENDAAQLRLREVYAGMLADGVPLVVTDLATAELAKVAANTMLAARISLVNLLAEVCEAAGADVADLATVLGFDERIGSSFLSPGLGFGGGCLPKDIRAFAARAEELGVSRSTDLVHAVDAVNMRQRSRAVQKTRDLVGSDLRGARLCVLGAAFKAGSDDVRDSPALDVATRLHGAGADVVVHDPLALPNAERAHPELSYEADVTRACTDADALVVLTDWDDYAALDPVALSQVVRHARVMDGRLAIDAEKWRAAGWDVRAMGR